MTTNKQINKQKQTIFFKKGNEVREAAVEGMG